MKNGHGIAATLTALADSAVQSGHVAGWVGVGGPGEGPNGTDEWLQVGLNSLPGVGHTLYYEVTRPGLGTQYVELARQVASGRTLRVALLEISRQPDTWRVWVDGRPASPPIWLQGSSGRLTPMAMAESWDGGRPACNRYAYRFDRVSLAAAPGGSWTAVRHTSVLEDPGYRVVRRSLASFDAAAARALPIVETPTAPAPAPVVAPAAEPVRSPDAFVINAKPIAATHAPLRKGVLPEPAVEVSVTALPQPAPVVPVVLPVVVPDAPAIDPTPWIDFGIGAGVATA